MKTTIGEERTERLQTALAVCRMKSRGNIEKLADAPKSWSFDPAGNYSAWPEGFYEIGNWTSSFHTGMGLLAWLETKDDFFLAQVQRMAPWYRKKVFECSMDTMHDLGFLYSWYSVALYKLTGDAAHREVGLRAAEVLAQRFMAKGGYIQAWGRMDDNRTDYAGLAIIDCMMNLPLLYWASAETGDNRFRDVAIQHARTTKNLFVRPDDSVYHAYRFDVDSGSPLRGDNYCGQNVDSHWARGTAWAMYGFTLSYSHTGEARFLATALRTARKFIRNLGHDPVPVWDFMLPPGQPRILDSSAAAIAVCGLQELLRHRPGEPDLVAAKDRMLDGLCSETFFDARPECAGVLKMGEVGDGVGRAKYAYTSWGDYYLMEALHRELGHSLIFW